MHLFYSVTVKKSRSRTNCGIKYSENSRSPQIMSRCWFTSKQTVLGNIPELYVGLVILESIKVIGNTPFKQKGVY